MPSRWRWLSGRFGARLAKETLGQDMVEYALMAGMVVVVVAAFLPPQVMPTISSIYSKVINLAAAVH